MLVIEWDPSTVDVIAAALSPTYEIAVADTLKEFETLGRDDVGVALIGGASDVPRQLDQARELIRSHPGFGALLIVHETSPELLRLALRSGVSDAIDRAQIHHELRDAVDALWARLERDLESTPFGDPRAGELAAVTTVFSPKGGVGKSVVAVNLATALAKGAERPVAILDLDLQFGDVAVMLRLQPLHTILDAVAAGEQLDAVLLESLMARHEPSGVLVLAAPTSPSGGDRIQPRDMLHVLAVLRSMCSNVVIDTPPQLNEVVLQAVAESDQVAFVVGMDVPSVKNARLGLQAFELLQLPMDKVILVLNRADSKVHLAVRDVERTLNLKVDVMLPSESLVPESVNEGNPAVLAAPKSKFVARIDALSKLLQSRRDARAALATR